MNATAVRPAVPAIERALIERLRKEKEFRTLLETGEPLVLKMLEPDEMMALPIQLSLPVGDWVKVRQFIDTDKDNAGATLEAAISLLTSEGIRGTRSCD